MSSSRWIFLAAILAAVAVSDAAVAQTESDTIAANETFILDEYNIDLFGASDSSRIAAGLSFGTAYANGWWWTAGPRLSYVGWSVDVPEQYGFGVGGAFGVGWHPERTVSPYAALAIDRDFNVGDLFDWETLVYVGARVKVTQDPREHFTMTFAAYHSVVFGGSSPGGGDTGIAILYSAVLFARRR